MGDLSRHFSRWEFNCRCGSNCQAAISPTVDIKLIEMCEAIRHKFNQVVTINSGMRCIAYNQSLKNSSKNSYHLQGRACDISVRFVSASDVYSFLDQEFPISGLGNYKKFTHLDSRLTKARWEEE